MYTEETNKGLILKKLAGPKGAKANKVSSKNIKVLDIARFMTEPMLLGLRNSYHLLLVNQNLKALHFIHIVLDWRYAICLQILKVLLYTKHKSTNCHQFFSAY